MLPRIEHQHRLHSSYSSFACHTERRSARHRSQDNRGKGSLRIFTRFTSLSLLALTCVARSKMSDVETNVHPPSVFGKHYDDMIPTAVVKVFAILEVTVYFALTLLVDPEIGSNLFWGSIAVATFSAAFFYTILWLQTRERLPMLFSRTIGLLLVVCVVYGIHGVTASEDPAFEIFLLIVLSIPLLIIYTVQCFKANLLGHHPQGSFNEDTLRLLDSLLSRILIGLGIIVSQLFVGMIVLMLHAPMHQSICWTEIQCDSWIDIFSAVCRTEIQCDSWIDIFLAVCLMTLVFGAFLCFLILFFLTLDPHPRQKKKMKNVVVETAAAIDEHTTPHREALLEPLLGQVDTAQNSKSNTAFLRTLNTLSDFLLVLDETIARRSTVH